jgi:hypothetical protein
MHRISAERERLWKEYDDALRKYVDGVECFTVSMTKRTVSRLRTLERGGGSATGEQDCWQRTRSLVPRDGQSSVCGAFQCLFKSLGLPSLFEEMPT